jgi:zinc transporter, ZIP family
MAVAIPIYASTGSIFKVLWWTFINGIAEPAGVLVGASLLGPYLDEFVLSRCLASVAGIMFCISLHELYPVSIKFSGKSVASASLFIGMFICWAAMEIVETYFGGHGHSHPDIHHLDHGHSHHSHGHDHHHDHHHGHGH